MKRAPNARWTRIFGLAGLLTLLRRVRRRADAKELAIESREQLFSMLVRNADDIYVMSLPMRTRSNTSVPMWRSFWACRSKR